MKEDYIAYLVYIEDNESSIKQSITEYFCTQSGGVDPKSDDTGSTNNDHKVTYLKNVTHHLSTTKWNEIWVE